MAVQSPKRRATKPAKPYPGFPLFPHASGYWAKKIRGRHHYFGKWEDPNGALRLYEEEREDLHAGRAPRRAACGEATLGQLCNYFLHTKQRLVDSGELTQQHLKDLRSSCHRVVDFFGVRRLVDDLSIEDFAALRAHLAKDWAPTTLRNEIARIRHLFRFAFRSDYTDAELKGLYALSSPSNRTLRVHRASRPRRLFSAAEVRSLIDAANNPQMRAFIYLGINCGFSNRDCAMIPRAAFDLDARWVRFPRTKTAIERRCPLWEETVEAVREALADRAEIPAKSEALEELAFLTSRGNPWGQDASGSPVSQLFSKVATRAGCRRKGVGYYALRHTFATVGGGCGDQVAVNFLMGHVDNSVAAAYREEVQDDRLKRVCRHVQSWLTDETAMNNHPSC